MSWRPLLLTCLLLGLGAPAVAAPPVATFGGTVRSAGSELRTRGWDAVALRLRYERQSYGPCLAAARACAHPELRAWLEMLEALRHATPMAQLRAVNDYLNRVPYVSDLANYGRSDRWATPAEFLLRGGDCEDYAIAKYVSLRRLGFADDSLRIVVVNDEARGIPHAVLSVRLDGASWILDNVTAAILADRDQPSYRPIYSLNMAGRWLHGRAGVEPAAAELR